MNIGNELAQIKNCKTIDEIKKFLENHNLNFDHWYLDTATADSIDKKGLYVVAYYKDIDADIISKTFEILQKYDLNGNIFDVLNDFISYKSLVLTHEENISEDTKNIGG